MAAAAAGGGGGGGDLQILQSNLVLVEILVENDDGDDEEGEGEGEGEGESKGGGDTDTNINGTGCCGNRRGNKKMMIDVSKYINYVRDPSCGAIASFEGTTRDSFEGKRVLELRYEAYVPMALRQLRSICSSARSTFSVHKIAVAHRLGIVPVGEASVFVAVSAVHRADALEACKYVIDQLKASVPIWKKEVYANGEVWKQNSEFFLLNNKKTDGCCSKVN